MVEPNMKRSLKESDANNRQLYLSVGCATENVRTAAEFYGWEPELSHIEMGHLLASKIDLVGTPKPPELREPGHPAMYAKKRRTNRGEYESREPSDEFQTFARRLSDDETEVHLVADSEKRSRLALIVSDALIEAMDDRGFRRELSEYLLPNVTNIKIGMTMSSFGVPTPASFVVPHVVPYLNVNRLSRKRDEALLRDHTPMFIVVATRQDCPRDWMRAGRIYQSMALQAEKLGLKTAVSAAPIQIGRHFQHLQSELGTEFRPQVFFRIGYAKGGSASTPRMPASDVVVQ